MLVDGLLGEDEGVATSNDQLFSRLRQLPAAGPLLEALGGLDGVYVVGGAVRDLMLGGAPTDLDLVVEGDPQAVLTRLGGSCVRHDRFGTATVMTGGFAYDIARSRRESYERPGALPEVEPAPLEEDLRRRDFTANAIAIALAGSQAGRLRAVPGALEDLAARRLRILHQASFRDDPTRLLRLARYGARLGFEIETQTRVLAQAALGAGSLDTVSGSRLGAELRLAAGEEDPVAAMAALGALGIDQAIQPGFGLSDQALARAALDLLPADGRRDRLTLAAAGLRLSREELAGLLDRLAFEAPDREAIVTAATQARPLASALTGARAPSEIARAVKGGGEELVALAGALGPRDAAEQWLGRWRTVRLEIDGHDVVAAGVPPGPAVGRALRAALAAKLDGRAGDRAQELAAALEAVSGEEAG